MPPEARRPRAVLLGAMVVLLAVAGGCGSASTRSPRARTAPVVAYPRSVPAGSVVLFGLDSHRLVTFDPVREAVDGTGNAAQTFQYPFPGRQDLFTSGSSSGYGFELLEVTGAEIRRIVAVKGRRGLFPLAADRERTLLVRQDYDAGGHPSRQQVVRLAGRSARAGRGRAARTLHCDGYCFFSDAAGVVVTVAPDASNARELCVFDPLSRRTLGSVTGDVVGFRIGARSIEVYGDALHKRISLSR
jgi:hypothetical protein